MPPIGHEIYTSALHSQAREEEMEPTAFNLIDVLSVSVFLCLSLTGPGPGWVNRAHVLVFDTGYVSAQRLVHEKEKVLKKMMLGRPWEGRL